MTGRPAVLFLAHRIPYPPDKGDKIRSYRILEHLGRRFDVHLAAFVDDDRDFVHEGALHDCCASVTLKRLVPAAARARSALGLLTGEPLTFPYYRGREMTLAIDALRRLPLAAEIVFSSSMAPYVARRAGRPRLVDLCDADSEKWRQYAENTRGPMRYVYGREARRLAAAEDAVISWADAAFAASPVEADVFNTRGAERIVDWFGNGVDADYFAPEADRACPNDAGDVVFVGAMDYRPNIEAACWFTREVWPRILAAAPDARFSVVGSNPTPEVRALARCDGVSVTGRVPDVRPYLQHAKVSVAPLRIARGVQNKVLEAMAAARAVVATSGAAAGIDAAPGSHFLVADDPAAFARDVAALLSDPERREALGRAARSHMVARYSWDAQLQRFDRVLERLTAEQ